MRRLVISAALFAVLPTISAWGADMPLKAPPPAPAAVYSWTGCYVGGNVGGIWEHDNTSIGIVDPTGVNTPAFVAGAIPNAYAYDRDGWLAGGQVGCDYQITNWVVGVESDFDGTGLNGGQTLNTAVPGFFPITSNVAQKLDWIGTTRARVGILESNTTLLYGTVGPAYGHVADSYFLSNVAGGGPVNSFASDSRTLIGWTAGGGVEVGFGHWSVKGEALYYDLGDDTLIRSCTLVTGGPCVVPDTLHPTRFENRGVIARIGLNYHFDGGLFPANP